MQGYDRERCKVMSREMQGYDRERCKVMIERDASFSGERDARLRGWYARRVNKLT